MRLKNLLNLHDQRAKTKENPANLPNQSIKSMEDHQTEFSLTVNGRIAGTSFKKIEELIVPYFKNLTKISFHDDDDYTVSLENKNWELDMNLSKILIKNTEEDYFLGAACKGTFEEGEKALKEFAAYLHENGFIYSLEYEDIADNEYLIQHPGWNIFFNERKQKTYPESEE